MRYEVRCCCDAEVFFGWLEAPEGEKTYTWIVLSDPHEERSASAPVDRVRMPIVPFLPRSGPAYLAVKADGVPIETLRRLRGFEERA